jgi:predicted CXXCH cytochrome family protein
MAGSDPGTGIQGTSHDLSSTGVGALYGSNDPWDRICIYCHAPHHAITAADAATAGIEYFPLWNHAVTTRTYMTYTNGLNAANGTQHQYNGAEVPTLTNGQPGSVSKLCLSCHDGSVALSQYGFAPALQYSGTTYIDAVDSRFLIGGGNPGDLRNHHPIGFDYRAVAENFDDEINPVDTPLLGANLYDLTIADLLWGDQMECSSCHDVHNTKNEGSKFVWVDDTNSNLCLTCHYK